MKFFGRKSVEQSTHEHVVGEPVQQAEQHESQKTFTDVEELSQDYLKFLVKRGVERGKFIRLGDLIFISPGQIQGHEGKGIMHKEILKRAMEKQDTKERILGAEALRGIAEETIGPDGLMDAGKFDIFFLPDGESLPDGTNGRFRTFGLSASFGSAEKESRAKTVDIAVHVLGSSIRVEDEPLMRFS